MKVMMVMLMLMLDAVTASRARRSVFDSQSRKA